MSEKPPSRSVLAVRQLLDADRPLIYLHTSEEERAEGVLRQVAEHARGGAIELYVWSVTDGLRRDGAACKNQPDGPRGVLDFAIRHDRPAIIFLKDFHEFIRDSAEIRRRLRDVYYGCLGSRKFVVIGSPLRVIPGEIQRELVYLKLPMPDRIELDELIRDEAKRLGTTLDEPAAFALGIALQGLTINEARHAIRHAVVQHGSLDVAAVPFLQEEKRLLVRKTGLIEYVPETDGLEAIGGLEVLKTWLRERRELFLVRDSLAAEIVPKGVLLMGVSGCGKSLAARVVANVFGLPLYRIDMVQVFAAGIALAEGLFAEACRTMEEIAPAVVWFDEIENSISRHHQDSSGVLDRIFGYFLTWMQERPPGLFVTATANRIDLLPAEMIRKGRFDQVFFLDLPTMEERQEIFEIHLSRRGVDPQSVSLELIAGRTDGWTGAEIEQSVVAALTSARIAGEPLTDKYLLPSLRQIVPLSKTMKEQVNHIRSWAFDRAVHATAKRR